MNSDSRKLLFLSTREFDSNSSLRGAFLLTDETSRPIEFRCTNPIRPTQLQSILYGEIMRDHILIELIGTPLIETLKELPDVIVIEESGFLALREKIDIPVVLISSDDQFISVGEDSGNSQMLNSENGRFEPIVIKTNSKFPNDKEIAKEVLSQSFNRFNLTEPFERIGNALEQVHSQKVSD